MVLGLIANSKKLVLVLLYSNRASNNSTENVVPLFTAKSISKEMLSLCAKDLFNSTTNIYKLRVSTFLLEAISNYIAI